MKFLQLRRTLALVALLLTVSAVALRGEDVQSSPLPLSNSTTAVRVTHYYATGNPMYSGRYPYYGAAACSWNFPLGTQILFWDGRIVTCEDRGLLGSTGWVDIFAINHYEGRMIQQSYEYYSGYEQVTILRWGWGDS